MLFIYSWTHNFYYDLFKSLDIFAPPCLVNEMILLEIVREISLYCDKYQKDQECMAFVIFQSTSQKYLHGHKKVLKIPKRVIRSSISKKDRQYKARIKRTKNNLIEWMFSQIHMTFNWRFFLIVFSFWKSR